MNKLYKLGYLMVVSCFLFAGCEEKDVEINHYNYTVVTNSPSSGGNGSGSGSDSGGTGDGGGTSIYTCGAPASGVHIENKSSSSKTVIIGNETFTVGSFGTANVELGSGTYNLTIKTFPTGDQSDTIVGGYHWHLTIGNDYYDKVYGSN